MPAWNRFRAALRAALDEHGVSQRALARALGTTNGTGMVSAVLSGRTPMVLDDLDRWLDKIGIVDPEQRARLWDLGIADYAPDYARRLADRLRDMERELEAIKAELAADALGERASWRESRP